jgi:hypothetical protein
VSLSGEKIMKLKTLALAVAMIATPTLSSFATTGPGCLTVVNVANWDRLNLRAAPRANARIVERINPNAYGILHLDRRCTPLNAPWGQRWCKVTHYNEGGAKKGYVKARFVRDNDCP